jgi:hypothetical protein
LALLTLWPHTLLPDPSTAPLSFRPKLFNLFLSLSKTLLMNLLYSFFGSRASQGENDKIPPAIVPQCYINTSVYSWLKVYFLQYLVACNEVLIFGLQCLYLSEPLVIYRTKTKCLSRGMQVCL